MAEPIEIERAHEWVPPKRGERSPPRCRICGAVRVTARVTSCYIETVEEV